MVEKKMQAKTLLEKALHTLPESVELETIRNNIHRSIRQLDESIKKSNRKTETITPLQRWNYAINRGLTMTPVTTDVASKIASKVVVNLNRMIDEEQRKLDALTQKIEEEPETPPFVVNG